MTWLGFSSLLTCLHGCRDTLKASRSNTIILNASDRLMELQIRVGSILKEGYILKPGSSKRLKCKAIYRAYMPGARGPADPGTAVGTRTMLYYYDETCRPYLWVRDGTEEGTTRVVKQQYISLDDLRVCSEIKILRDHQRGCVAVDKKSRRH